VKLKAGFATALTASRSGHSDSVRAPLTLSSSHESKGSGVPSKTTRRARLAAAVAVAFFAVMLVTSGDAHATTGHSLIGSFGGPGEAEGELGPKPMGLGVGLSGDVFTTDFLGRIQRFDATGAFQASITPEFGRINESGAVAVDSSPGGGVYVAEITGIGVVAKYSPAGVFLYELDASTSETTINSTALVAVDPADGTVYVTATNTTGAPVIDSFSQTTGAFIASFNGESGSPDGGFACPAGLAVDPSHSLYVFDPCKSRVDRYSTAGVYEATVDNGSRGAPQVIATDPKTGELYVAESGVSGLQITNFSAGGASVIYTFAEPNITSVAAMAIGPDGTVYVADGAFFGNAVVDRFTSFVGPTVTTAAASPVERTTATLNGTIDPGGIASKYHYEYGLDTRYGSSTAPIDAGSGSGAIEAAGPVAGLVPNTTYHYRIVGTNASGSIVGADETLTTAAAPPTVDGSPTFVTTITPTGARVHATVNPQHSLTTFRIEYGTTTSYGSSTPEVAAEVGEQSSDQAVATTLTGLQPATLYHYRVSAENGVEGPQTGADATFITSPAAPASASEVTARKATLSGTIDPHGAATTYHFNYGPTTAYGARTSEVSGGSGSSEQAVSEHITGLNPGTTYHVQVVATTNGITRSGADGTFTTQPAPVATVSDPIAVSTSSATLRGAADTHGLAGSYHFEVTATEGAFAKSTPEQSLPAATGAQSVSAPVSGLPSGQGLQVRLVVSSNEAIDVSAPASFATASLPPADFPAPPAASSVYGCSAPHLNPYNAKAKPGSSIAITGSDLGLTGSVLLGEDSLLATNWSGSGFTIEVPADAAGTLGLTVNCGHASNTIAIATSVARLPSNAFSTGKATVKGSTATLTLTLPGPGKLQLSGAKTKGVTSTIAKAGTQTVKVALSGAGLGALRKAKHRTLAVKVALSFTPTGGQAATKTVTLSFKRRAGH
jgi:hypothetical protein